MKENEAKSLLVVVDPGYITLIVEPKDQPGVSVDYLVSGRDYVVLVSLFDNDGRSIFYNGVS